MRLLGDGTVHLLGSCFHLHIALSYSLESQYIHTLTMTTLRVHILYMQLNTGPNNMLSEALGLAAAAKLLQTSWKLWISDNSDMISTASTRHTAWNHSESWNSQHYWVGWTANEIKQKKKALRSYWETQTLSASGWSPTLLPWLWDTLKHFLILAMSDLINHVTFQTILTTRK